MPQVKPAAGLASFGNPESDQPALPPTAGLEQTLKNRRHSRSFSPEPLSLETLSALLRAGFGINRRDTGGRTAPSARNSVILEGQR